VNGSLPINLNGLHEAVADDRHQGPVVFRDIFNIAEKAVLVDVPDTAVLHVPILGIAHVAVSQKPIDGLTVINLCGHQARIIGKQAQAHFQDDEEEQAA
jgi:hypothetical protein